MLITNNKIITAPPLKKGGTYNGSKWGKSVNVKIPQKQMHDNMI